MRLPVERPWARSVYWMYGVVLAEGSGMDAEELSGRLRERGVETRPFFLGMHEQPALHRLGLFAGESYPVAESIARQGLYLPSGLTLTEAQIDRVAATRAELAVSDSFGPAYAAPTTPSTRARTTRASATCSSTFCESAGPCAGFSTSAAAPARTSSSSRSGASTWSGSIAPPT